MIGFAKFLTISGGLLVLASFSASPNYQLHNYGVNAGPNYRAQIDAINRQMRSLSAKHHLTPGYELTLYTPTNWPKVGF